jgi:hypothetical protein
MRLTLQEMVSSAIAEATAREKLAQAGEAEPEKKEEKSPASAEKKNGGEKKEGEEKEKESAGYKCASADTGTVEKVAQALDFINANMDKIDWSAVEKQAVGKPLPPQKPNAPAPAGGPGAGPGSDVQTNVDQPTLGTQSEQTGQATGQAQPEPDGSKDDVGAKDGQTNPDTAMLTDMKHVPGGTGTQPTLDEPGGLPTLKQASIQKVRELWAMKKQAADAESPAQIKGGPEPLENPDGTAAEEGVPRQPAAFEAQAKLVRTADPAKPADITKGQAKAEPKRQMGKVLDEPAQKKSTDPVLHQNLDAAAGSGVKLSAVQAKAARAYLRKLAQAGESEEATPEEKEKAKKLKEALAKKKSEGEGKEEKEKESQGMPPVGAAGAPPSTTMPPAGVGM